jgi:DNA replication and repair protein RecF
MKIDALDLQQFRNYERLSMEFSPTLNLLVGENAQGKTNALEAIYLLALGKSHRGQKDSELMRFGASHTTIEGNISLRERKRKLKLEFQPTGRKASINGIPQTKMTDFIGHFQVVLFAPEDLMLVKGSPAVRRRFLDMELGQTHPKYLYHLGQYTRTMQQRNTLLKRGGDEYSLPVFDAQLVSHGAQIMHRRIQFLQKMQPLSQKIYADISDHREDFTFSYASSLTKFVLTPESTIAEIEHAFEESLAGKRETDLRLGSTSVGPHRDDLVFFLNEKSVHAYASQGQQRTIALALRLAEIDFIYGEIGEYPVLLLDDVLSELDDARQRNLVLSMSQKVQTILTTTSLFQLENELQSRSRLFYVSSGIIQTEG